jgi:hypothetical protein
LRIKESRSQINVASNLNTASDDSSKDAKKKILVSKNPSGRSKTALRFGHFQQCSSTLVLPVLITTLPQQQHSPSVSSQLAYKQEKLTRAWMKNED